MLDYRRFKEINELFATGQMEKARHLLMEMQSHCIALRDELDLLKIRLQSAEDALYLSRSLIKEDKLYWLNTASLRLGPFCSRCYETDGALIRLEKQKSTLICPYCNEIYQNCLKHPPTDSISPAHARILRFAR